MKKIVGQKKKKLDISIKIGKYKMKKNHPEYSVEGIILVWVEMLENA
jgi:hypothetical protein